MARGINGLSRAWNQPGFPLRSCGANGFFRQILTFIKPFRPEVVIGVHGFPTKFFGQPMISVSGHIPERDPDQKAEAGGPMTGTPVYELECALCGSLIVAAETPEHQSNEEVRQTRRCCKCGRLYDKSDAGAPLSPELVEQFLPCLVIA